MGRKVELSEKAREKRERLPPNVRTDLDEFLSQLAASPPSLIRTGAIDIDGIAPDGTHYYIEILYHVDETAGALFVDSIEPEAY